MTEDDWIAANAAALVEALADEGVRAEVLALLGHDDSEQRGRHRREAAQRDLETRGLLNASDPLYS
jgi:phage head maturation protease